MNDTMKLLRAFIKASGYEIEDIKGTRYSGLNPNEMGVSYVCDYKVTKKVILPDMIQTDVYTCTGHDKQGNPEFKNDEDNE